MNILLSAVQSPDMDGVSAALAYASFLQQTTPSNDYLAAFQGPLLAEARFACQQVGISPAVINDDQHQDKFILLDGSEPMGLPDIFRLDDVIEVIDHRSFANFAAFPNAQFRVEPVGAAATQIAELFYFNRSANLNAQLATLLLCGIYSNTVLFQSDTTTFRDERMRDWLESVRGTQYPSIVGDMFEYKSRDVLEHLKDSLLLDAKDNCNQFG